MKCSTKEVQLIGQLLVFFWDGIEAVFCVIVARLLLFMSGPFCALI
jgi:hypothetical protein